MRVLPIPIFYIAVPACFEYILIVPDTKKQGRVYSMQMKPLYAFFGFYKKLVVHITEA